MRTEAKILVVGSVNMDVITPLRRLPQPGETIHTGDITLVPGGKGANTAVAAARMGGCVRFAGSVGKDAFGKTLRQAMQNEGIDTTKLADSDRTTGTAVVLLDQTSGENAIMVGPGANSETAAPTEPEWYAWGDILLLQLETPVNTALRAAQNAKAQGTRVLLDPAPASSKLPPELLSAVDILVPNESELATLTDLPAESIEQVAHAAKTLITRAGVGEVVVTLGARGALWVTKEKKQYFPAPIVTAIDTTAAGDTFAGTLAVALASGKTMAESIHIAVTAGALACTRMGAQHSIPYGREVQEKLAGSALPV